MDTFVQTCRRHDPKSESSGGLWTSGDNDVSILYHVCPSGVGCGPWPVGDAGRGGGSEDT